MDMSLSPNIPYSKYKRCSSLPNITTCLRNPISQYNETFANYPKIQLSNWQKQIVDYKKKCNRKTESLSDLNNKVIKSESIDFLLDYKQLHLSNQTSAISCNKNVLTSPTPQGSYSSNFSNITINSSLYTDGTFSCTSDSGIAAKSINLINTSDIKIWNELDSNQCNDNNPLESVVSSIIIPSNLQASKDSLCSANSTNPVNSFLTFFSSTPTKYDKWFHGCGIGYTSEQNVTDQVEIALDCASCASLNISEEVIESCRIGVLDSFAPVNGTKLPSRNSQNLFDDHFIPMNLSNIKMQHIQQDNNSDKGLENICNESNCNSNLTAHNSQSLMTYLQNSYLSRNNTDLEKENAHFHISEAIISAIEHVKWNKLQPKKPLILEEETPIAIDYLSRISYSENTSKNSLDNTKTTSDKYHEVYMDALSAEVVGLALISKFNENHLPKISELKWLVSDEDTPQKLLPVHNLTNSTYADDEALPLPSATRGNRYWAPPRSQIIFTLHPPPNRKKLLRLQNFRCAGCGMRVTSECIYSLRYCTYFGKFNCTGCHRNQISCIPAKILQTWDFKYYPVSVFAYKLLEQIYHCPLFRVSDLNSSLYKRSKTLACAREKRQQLKYIRDFIQLCRFAEKEQQLFFNVPLYITEDVDNWSMSDFMDTRQKYLHSCIDKLIKLCEDHIFNCLLCTSRGFLCEYCHSNIIIYPWNSHIQRCQQCGSCFHRSCWKSTKAICCRCKRLQQRSINDDGILAKI